MFREASEVALCLGGVVVVVLEEVLVRLRVGLLRPWGATLILSLAADVEVDCVTAHDVDEELSALDDTKRRRTS